MTFQVVPNTCTFVIETGSSAKLWTNVINATKTLFTVEDMQDGNAAIWTAFSTYLMPAIADDFSLRKITAYDQREDGGWVEEYAPTPVAGGDSGSILPVGVALVLTQYTNTRGRSGRGRMYFSGWTEGYLSGGLFTSGASGVVETLAYQLHVALSAQGWLWSVVSRYHNNVKRAEGVTYPITDETVRSLIPGSQDRRDQRP